VKLARQASVESRHRLFKEASRGPALIAEPNVSHASRAADGSAAAEAAPVRASSLAARALRDGRLLSLVSVVFVIALWQWGAGHVSGFLLPPPGEVLGRFLDPKWLSRLTGALGQSLVQLGFGFALTLVVAAPLGVIIGRSVILTRMFEPVINAIYAIPPVAFIPFLIVWFGLFLEARVALVFLMSVFDVLVIVIAGARDVRSSLVDVGRSFGASHRQRLRLIVLPALLPFLFAALRVGSARAINGMITAELFFAAVNLGAIMKRATQNFDSATVLAVVLLVCVLGLLAQSAIGLLERRVLHWHVRPA
jgi:ABC-type nitrate/sulfonate/bicarbonate transport system permease component